MEADKDSKAEVPLQEVFFCVAENVPHRQRNPMPITERPSKNHRFIGDVVLGIISKTQDKP